MSISVNQILNDAKRLVTRLREHDSTADAIIAQTQTLYKNVEATKEYNEEVSEQNITNQMRSKRPSFLFNAQLENKHIRDLLQENRELKEMLEEHQSLMGLIMSKYRQKATQMITSTSTLNESSFIPDTQEMQKMAESICEIADVMKQSVVLDDLSYVSEQEKITELITENKGLRELLDISKNYGSLQVPLNTPEMIDKEVQTET